MTEIWLVRHGQTNGNLHNIVQGQLDIPLNETGEAQARTLADQLADVTFAAIYSSDLSRAMQTASIIASKKGLTVVPDPRLREIRQGIWEGLHFEQVLQIYQPDFSPNPFYITTPRAEGAESIAEVVTRMVDAANEYHARHPGERVLMSTHGIASASLYCLASGIPLVNAGEHIPKNGQPLIIHLSEPLNLPDFTISLS